LSNNYQENQSNFIIYFPETCIVFLSFREKNTDVLSTCWVLEWQWKELEKIIPTKPNTKNQ